MGVNSYFVHRITDRPHATPNYRPRNQSLKLIIIDRHNFSRKTGLYMSNVGMINSRSNVFFKNN